MINACHDAGIYPRAVCISKSIQLFLSHMHICQHTHEKVPKNEAQLIIKPTYAYKGGMYQSECPMAENHCQNIVRYLRGQPA